MKRNYSIDAVSPVLDDDLLRQTVYHEAGHAAAIYLYNKQKRLPSVHFQITIKNTDPPAPAVVAITAPHEHLIAMVEGGCLINGLPITLLESCQYYAPDEQDSYRMAFEADIVNLLVGPLAEAKHIALRNQEVFGEQPININSLRHYGGQSDLERAYGYLGDFIADTSLHEEKLAELFKQAMQFINAPAYWQAIERLAAYILGNTNHTISCEEAITVLDAGITL